MILLDRPRDWGWAYGASAHLISSLPGKAGSAELAAFAEQVGLRPQWLQRAGTEYEHFDLTQTRCQRALRCGARLVTSRELIAVIRVKRGSRRP